MDYEEIEILKRIEEAKKEKASCDIKIGEYDLQLHSIKKCKTEPLKKEGTIRKYGKSAINNRPIIKSLIMPDDVTTGKFSDAEVGHFEFSRGTVSKYSIMDLYLLKKEIPNVEVYSNFTKLGELINIDPTTTSALCMMIEKGMFEPYFKFWINTFGRPMFNNNGQLIF